MAQRFAVSSVRIPIPLFSISRASLTEFQGLKYGGGEHLWVLSAEDFTVIWQVSKLNMQT